MDDLAYTIILLVVVFMMLGIVDVPQRQKKVQSLRTKVARVSARPHPHITPEIARLRDQFRTRFVSRPANR